MTAADLHGDGDAELIVADYNNGVLVYRNRGPVPPPPVADLNVVLSSPATVRTDVAFAQAVTVTNQGNVARSGTLRVDVASLLRIQSWTAPACSVAGQSLTCAVPTLAAGGRYGVSVTVKAAKTGSASTTAALTATSPTDADPSDNTASVAVTITKK